MDQLRDAYLHTTYYLRNGHQELSLRIGKRHAQLDTLLLNHGCMTWAFVSAWNPLSQQISKAENEAAHRRLVAAVTALGWPHFKGRGIGDRKNWPPEPGVFIFGLSLHDALRLGQQFTQLAIIAGERGTAPALHFCLPPTTMLSSPAA